MDNEVLVDVARLVGANHAAFDYHAVAGLSQLDCVDIILVLFPVFCLQVEDSGVHLVDVCCMWNHHRRTVEIVVATCHHSNCHEQQEIEI